MFSAKNNNDNEFKLRSDTQQRLKSLNEEYLQTIAKFYFYLELNFEGIAKNILNQLIKRKQESDFLNMPELDTLVNEKAQLFYQAFYNMTKDVHISSDQLYDHLKKFYLEALRPQIDKTDSPSVILNASSVMKILSTKADVIRRGYNTIVATVGDPGVLGQAFHSYESAGVALMKRMLKNNNLTAEIIAALDDANNTHLTNDQRTRLRESTKEAFRKQNSLALKECDYLISKWEREIVDYLPKIKEKTDIHLAPSIQQVTINIPSDKGYELPSEKSLGNKITAEQCLDKEVGIEYVGPENSMWLLQNNGVMDYLMKTYHKLKPTYQIKNTLETEQRNLTDMVKRAQQAANIFKDNITQYRNERDPLLRDVLYGLAIVFCVPTAGLTLFAAMIYSYKTTGTCLFFSQNARTSSNSISESFQDGGIKMDKLKVNYV